MATDMHPETETLKAYLQNIDASEFDALRLHLAGCTDCRNEVSALSALDGFIPASNTAGFSDQQHALICDFVDGRLHGEARTEIEDLVQHHPEAMKAALHYASHSASMEAIVDETMASVIPDVHTDTQHDDRVKQDVTLTSMTSYFYTALLRWLNLRPPLWMAVPATAFAIAVLAVSLQTFFKQHGETYTVAGYQDNPVMQFTNEDTLPGIGFFSKADVVTRAYTQVRISVIDARHLKIDWPQVDNAALYNMRLQLIDQNQKTLIGEVSTEIPGAEFETAALATGHRYEWQLSGKTNDDTGFYATGGFVINRTD